MPFQFTGKPPALLSGANALGSAGNEDARTPGPFAAPSMSSTSSFGGAAPSSSVSTPFAPPSSSGAPTSFPAPTPFGTPASFGALVSSFGTPASFGASASPWSKPKPKPIEPSSAAIPRIKERSASQCSKFEEPLLGNDALSKALSRAVKGRSAFFNAVDVGADAVIERYQKTLPEAESTTGIPHLRKELAIVAREYPQAMDFLRFVFQEAGTIAKVPAKMPTTEPLYRTNKAKAVQITFGNYDPSPQVQATLEPPVHARMVENGWAKQEKKSTRAGVAVQIALESETKDSMIRELIEDDFPGSGSRDPRFHEFADWLWQSITILRDRECRLADHGSPEYAATSPPPYTDQAGPQESVGSGLQDASEERDEFDFFKPHVETDEKMAAMAKTGNYNALGYLGYQGSTPSIEGRPCCDRHEEVAATRWISGHWYLSEDEVALLRTWIVKKIEGLTAAGPKIAADPGGVADNIVARLSASDPETAFRTTTIVNLDDPHMFVTELFEAIATKAYIPLSALPDDISITHGENRSPPTPPTTDVQGQDSPEKPFRFLDLPPELRTWIYREVLIPGVVRLRICEHYMPYGVLPAPTTGVLATCKQVNREAKDLVLENTFIVDAIIDSSTRRMFHPKMLPNHILPHLTSLVIVVNLHRLFGDWRQMRGLVGLKQLTVCAFERSAYDSGDWQFVVQNILECVPAECSIKFGPRSVMENQHLWAMQQRLSDDKMTTVDTYRLGTIMEDLAGQVVKGSKSGMGAAAKVVQPGEKLLWGYM